MPQPKSQTDWQHFLPSGHPPERIYTLARFVSDLRALLARRPAVLEYYSGTRVSAKLREEIFVAVSAVNACRYCSYLHRDWAQAVGVDAAELAALTGATQQNLDRKTLLAINYAAALADAEFGSIDVLLAQNAEKELTAQERDDIENLARMITMMNRAGNTVDWLALAVQGKAPNDGTLLKAAPVGVAMALGMSLFVPLWAIATRRSPIAILKGLSRFSQSFARER